MGAIDKNIITLDVTMDDRRGLGVKVKESSQKLLSPATNNLDARVLQLRNISKTLEAVKSCLRLLSQCPRSHHLSDKDKFSVGVPRIEEGDDVRMANTLKNFNLLRELDKFCFCRLYGDRSINISI